MGKYLIKRILRGIASVVAVIVIVMALVYSLMDRELVFAKTDILKYQNNARVAFKNLTWERYGYLDYVEYSDYLATLEDNGEISAEESKKAAKIARKAKDDSPSVGEYVERFRKRYESEGYTVERRDAMVKSDGKSLMQGGAQILYAYKNIPLAKRLWGFFAHLIEVDNIHKAETAKGKREIRFVARDPAYGGKFSPAIIGNGTKHKYLLYFDKRFPYVHQNLVTVNLGVSYSVSQGVELYETMMGRQGEIVKSDVTYPTGHREESADDLHSAAYQKGSLEKGGEFAQKRFADDYTRVETNKMGKSRIGYSFIIGIISVIMAYVLGVPLGIAMARKKDKFADKIGTAYIVFIMAVPSLAYIFMFKAIGHEMGLPTTFDTSSAKKIMYVLPIVSLALPSVANLMKWLRRYMIDQMNSDYVKFARSGGLSEREIFGKHILKNAIIPLMQGIPAAVLGSLVGAIITERVYVVPGAGNLLTDAIAAYDNSVIVGVTLFYAILSVASLIMGDLLMAATDPRISFTEKRES